MPKKNVDYGDFTILNIVSQKRIQISPKMAKHLDVEEGDQIIIRYGDDGVLEMRKFDKKVIHWGNK